MSSKILAVLLVAFSGVLVQAGPNKDLVFLGKSETTASLYYRSMDRVAWTGVAQICKDLLGVTATPLFLEETAELVEVRTFLTNSEANTQYWIGGQWNTTKNIFEWENEVAIGSEWAGTWDAGYPNSQTPSTKIMLWRENVLSVKFRTTFYTEDHLFICELPR